MRSPLSSPASLISDRGCLTRSGLRYGIRPVRGSDEAALRAMFASCSAEDLRLRCCGVSKAFPEVFAARLARLSEPSEFAIVATMDGGGIGGVVHAVALPGSAGEADYDIMVRTDLKGQGIGSRLMRAMLSEAARAGFGAVHGDVMMGNRAMLMLAGDLGFRRIAIEAGIVRIRAAPQMRDAGPQRVAA